MKHRIVGKKLLSLTLALIMVLSMFCVMASAADNVYDAKASLADVTITQTCDGVTTDSGVHNYSTREERVDVTYSATLRMTEEMAIYLQARQAQLCRANFNIHMNVDMEVLEFDTDSTELTFTFTSTFLKPVPTTAADGYTSYLDSYTDGVFTYILKVDRAWAERQRGEIVVPMELIVYTNAGRDAYGFDEALDAGYGSEQVMYKDFSVEDWMHEIKLTLADMKVRDGIAETVTYDSRTWRTVKAWGTVDGDFSYIRLEEPQNLADMDRLSRSYGVTLRFGNDQEVTEWVSNVVQVLLKREIGTIIPGVPDSPFLNLTDHFAYIIGRPDGYVYPQATITRAEVATIFFRMLTDETRNYYWSKTNNYSDVSSTDWYNNAISTLSKLGIIDGYPDGTFRPMAGITRAEFAKMAVSFFELTESQKNHADIFSDISTSWARQYINAAYLCNIISGYPDGTFKPAKLITRAEAMTIVNNTLRRTPHKDHLLPGKDMITWPDNMDKNQWYYAAVQEATNSHEYRRASITDYEVWTKELPVRDWAAFERAWSDANSATNPGEVVNGN